MDFIRNMLDFPVLSLGSVRVTVASLLYVTVATVLLFYLSAKLRNVVANRLLVYSELDIGSRQGAASIVRYVVVAVGLLIILQTTGIDLTALNILAGAVGLGVGFGLQDIANNFISGLIILFERPIKIGDRIEVGAISGDVIDIGARSTTVVTNDNIAIIIPNSKLISENVVNWSHSERRIRFRIPINVAYGSDVRLVEKVLLDVAYANPDVLKDPAPVVRFLEFRDSGLNFELRAWTTNLLQRKGRLVSAINFAIHDKFEEHQIHIPLPQLEVSLRRNREQPQ
jgi:small-conductance mechanosensitive channel